MKILLIILLSLSFVKADEMSRIEAIVADITELRVDYNECKKELKNKDTSSIKKYKKLYKKEKEKNTILTAELEYSSDLDKSNKILSKRVREIEKELKSIKKLRNKQDDFPKLIMKEEFEKKSVKEQTVHEEKLVRFKATSYHLKFDSIIYDGIDGKMITKWVKTTSFTSSVKTQSWIKITGYFVNKQWKAAKKDMWVKIKQVQKK